MKTKTDLKAGISLIGSCRTVHNRYGHCKKIVCPYPPYNFPCKKRVWQGPQSHYFDVPGEPD